MSATIQLNKDSAMLVRSENPFNAGPPPDKIHLHYITPLPLFFVRNHGSVPVVDVASYRLTVSGAVREPLTLSLHDLQSRFPKCTLTATLECAGNRRQQLMKVAPIPGEVPWDGEAISNGTWGGAALRDVLTAAGVRAGAQHVAFKGLDHVERHDKPVGFGSSIPLDKALSGDVLLAYELNGEPLPPTHGFPLRALVPGYIGARSVKWLASITVQSTPSDNYFQTHAYKMFPPHITAETADWDRGEMLGEIGTNSVICQPTDEQTVKAGRVILRGYAIAGGSRTLEGVEVSADGGQTWQKATVLNESRSFTWSLWEATLALAPGRHWLAVRAWDSAGQTQPEAPSALWNFKGYMNNAWHRIQITAV